LCRPGQVHGVESTDAAPGFCYDAQPSRVTLCWAHGGNFVGVTSAVTGLFVVKNVLTRAALVNGK